MLQKLRDQTQGFGFKVLVGVLIFVLAIFGFGAFNLFATGEPEAASVNGDSITQVTLATATEREQRRLAIQLGEQFDPSQLDLAQVQSRALDQLIGRTLLRQALDDLNMKVSRARAEASVRDNPAFQIDGRYDADAYRQMVQGLRYTPQEFLRETRTQLSLDQLESGLSGTAFMTGWEMAQSARLLNQERDLAYLEFTAAAFSEQVLLVEEEVRLYYDENQLEFYTDESADTLFVELSAAGLVDDPEIVVTDDEVQAAYAADLEIALLGDQRKSSHILLEVSDDRSAEEARALLEELKGRAVSGAIFAALAREYSDDPGSAAQGGSLGAMGKGILDPDFERALWALEEGEVSDPIQTEFGYHLISLEEILVTDAPPLEELREDLEHRLKLEQAEELFARRVRELDSLAFEQPEGLGGIEQEMGLVVQSVSGVTASAGQGVFANTVLREAVFSSDVLSKGFNSPAIELTDSRAVVLRVAQRHKPQLIAFFDVQDQIRELLLAQAAERLAEDGHAAALERVQAGEGVSQVANDYGLHWQTHGRITRNNSEVPQSVLKAGFDLMRPAEGGKTVGRAVLLGGGQAIVTVTRVVDGDIALMAEREIEGIRAFLDRRAANLDFTAFYSSLEQNASIDRNL